MPFKDKARYGPYNKMRRNLYRDRYGASLVTDYRTARKLRAIAYLGGVCVDCGCGYHYSVFDFHHAGAKDASVWDLIRRSNWRTIQRELDKCVLLCANCHRLRHAREGGNRNASNTS